MRIETVREEAAEYDRTAGHIAVAGELDFGSNGDWSEKKEEIFMVNEGVSLYVWIREMRLFFSIFLKTFCKNQISQQFIYGILYVKYILWKVGFGTFCITP